MPYKIHHAQGQAGNAATRRTYATRADAIAVIKAFAGDLAQSESCDGSTTYMDQDPDVVAADDAAACCQWAVTCV